MEDSGLSSAELRALVLNELRRLDDPDTSFDAKGKLHEILDNLELDTLPIFVDCIVSVTGQQTVFARSTTCGVIVQLAALYRRDMLAHGPRLLAAATTRLRDSEPAVREAAAHAVGQIAKYVLCEEGAKDKSISGLSGLWKPIFSLLHERHEYAQNGASLALQKVFESCSSDQIRQEVARVAPAMIRRIAHPHVTCRGALFDALGALFRAVGAQFIRPYLASVLPSSYEAMKEQKQWTLRRSAISFINVVVDIVPHPEIVPHKHNMEYALERVRYDRILSVRELARDVLAKVKDTIPSPIGSKTPGHMTFTLSASKKTRPPPDGVNTSSVFLMPSPSPSARKMKRRNVQFNDTLFEEEKTPKSVKKRSNVPPTPPSRRGIDARREEIKLEKLEVESSGKKEPVKDSKKEAVKRSDVEQPKIKDVKASEEVIQPPQNEISSKDLQQVMEQQRNLVKTFEKFSEWTRDSLETLASKLGDMEGRIEEVYTNFQTMIREQNVNRSVEEAENVEEESKMEKSGGFSDLWKQAEQLLKSNDVSGAFQLILESGDRLQLVKLMRKAGIVLQSLTDDVRGDLVDVFIEMIKRNSFLDIVLHWIDRGVDEGMALPEDTIESLLRALALLSAAPTPHGIHAASLYSTLHSTYEKAKKSSM